MPQRVKGLSDQKVGLGRAAPPVPIIIISFNRLWTLSRSIASYRQLEGHTLVIHDTGSTHEPLLEYLSELEAQGVEVWRNRPSITRPEDLNSVDLTVQEWLARRPDTLHYVVTDPDICLGDGCQDLLAFYRHVLERHDAIVVGPMLRIDDIPANYPLRERVVRGHSERYWSQVPETIRWNGEDIQYQRAIIDTTFGMYPARLPFRRLNEGYRTRAPYWARHLDWYIDPEHMQSDQLVYMQGASAVSHWGGDWLRAKLANGVDPSFRQATQEEATEFARLVRRGQSSAK